MTTRKTRSIWRYYNDAPPTGKPRLGIRGHKSLLLLKRSLIDATTALNPDMLVKTAKKRAACTAGPAAKWVARDQPARIVQQRRGLIVLSAVAGE